MPNANNRHISGAALLVMGVHAGGDAYPNVHHKVRALRDLYGTREINIPLPMSRLARRRGSPLWRIFSLVTFSVLFVSAHLRVLAAYLRTPTPASLYIPYPAAGVLWLLSWLSQARRPKRIVADVFISLYDTVVEDRQLLPTNSVAARLLLAFERRAYRYADVLVTDTDPNVEYLINTFNLAKQNVTAMPLAIDETTCAMSPYRTKSGECRVLFVGTFVPLQGADIIAHSIVQLANHPTVRFRLVGYGQSAPQIENILAESNAQNWSWEKNWLNSAAVAEEIRAADICLGIFGSGHKTQRVWPLKNYAYMAIGRALITADTHYAQELLARNGNQPFITVPAGDPDALSRAIVALADDPQLRLRLATHSRNYYDGFFCSVNWISQLKSLMKAPGHE